MKKQIKLKGAIVRGHAFVDRMTFPKPSKFSDDAMCDRLVEEHRDGQHEQDPHPLFCPLCETEASELLDETDEPEDA